MIQAQKKEIKRPLCVTDIVEYRGHSFLVAFVYDKGVTVGEIIAPLYDIVKSGMTIAEKLIEIVEVSCKNQHPLAFDLYTCSDTIYKETLSSPYVLTQMKAKSECSECHRIMENPVVIETLDDIYIKEYLKEVKDAKERDKKERSARGKLKQFFKTMRDKMVEFICRLGLSAK